MKNSNCELNDLHTVEQTSFCPANEPSSSPRSSRADSDTEKTLNRVPSMKNIPRWKRIQMSAEAAERARRDWDAAKLWHRLLYFAETSEGELSDGATCALDALGRLYLRNMKYSRAEKMFLESIRRKSIRLNGSHATVIFSLHQLSIVYSSQGLTYKADRLRSHVSRRINQIEAAFVHQARSSSQNYRP